MRAYPSAAPVTTPSNRPSTQRISPTRSRASTMLISEVPGFAKQLFTPPATRVRTRISAPFIVGSFPIDCFFHVTSKHRGQTREVRTDHPQMIARHGLDRKFCCHTFPKSSGIVREIRVGLGPHESYLAFIKPGPITF